MMWDAWAHKRPDGVFADVGPKSYTEAHGGRDPVVPVRAEEVSDEAARTHWGWIDSGDTEPSWSLVWPSKAQFDCCFPYGVRNEVARGRGTIIYLKITESA